MKINKNMDEILKEQYLQPGESVDEMLWRVCRYVAEGEKRYNYSDKYVDDLTRRFHDSIDAGLWIPSSPFLMNAGTSQPMLSACYVLGIDDSMESIFETLKSAALIHKGGGGTGFDFSPLRPKGSIIKSTGGTSTGVLSFLSLFNLEGDVVRQGGRRRSANLATLRVDHPEILEFIDAKLDLKAFNNFNFSVGIPDWFMEKVLREDTYDLIDHEGHVIDTKSAKEVFDRIISNNWRCSEPGILYIDNINRDSKLKHLGKITSTNPCGEVPLLPGEACNLASINLDKFVSKGMVDWDSLAEIVRLATNFLDLSIDVNKFPLGSIDKAVKRTRKLGLGIIGLHGMLIQLGLKYNTPEGRNFAGNVMKFIRENTKLASIELAQRKSVPEGWYGSDWEKEGIKIRNLQLNCIAPTGTISMILDSSSSGCEPIFAVVYERKSRGKIYRWVNPLFEKIAREEGWYSETLVQKILANKGRVTGITEVPKQWRDLFITAQEISPNDHVLMQSELQKYVDGSISKTINMPEDSTIEEVREVYINAWRLGCKGLTIYREGTREGVLKAGAKEKKVQVQSTERPKLLIGATSKIQSGCGKLWVTINPYKGKIWEVFASTGADGGCSANIQEIARLISLASRKGIGIEDILDQLKSVKCAHAIASKKCNVKSCSDAIARVIEEFLRLYKPEIWDGFLEELSESLLDENNKEIKGDDDYNFLEDILRQEGCKSGKCI